MEGNGTALPKIEVRWDAATQNVQLDFDTKQFKSWDFLVAVLDMAKAQAEFNRRMAQQMAAQQAMQQQVMAAQEQEAVKRLLVR